MLAEHLRMLILLLVNFETAAHFKVITVLYEPNNDLSESIHSFNIGNHRTILSMEIDRTIMGYNFRAIGRTNILTPPDYY